MTNTRTDFTQVLYYNFLRHNVHGQEVYGFIVDGNIVLCNNEELFQKLLKQQSKITPESVCTIDMLNVGFAQLANNLTLNQNLKNALILNGCSVFDITDDHSTLILSKDAKDLKTLVPTIIDHHMQEYEADLEEAFGDNYDTHNFHSPLSLLMSIDNKQVLLHDVPFPKTPAELHPNYFHGYDELQNATQIICDLIDSSSKQPSNQPQTDREKV